MMRNPRSDTDSPFAKKVKRGLSWIKEHHIFITLSLGLLGTAWAVLALAYNKGFADKGELIEREKARFERQIYDANKIVEDQADSLKGLRLLLAQARPDSSDRIDARVLLANKRLKEAIDSLTAQSNQYRRQLANVNGQLITANDRLEKDSVAEAALRGIESLYEERGYLQSEINELHRLLPDARAQAARQAKECEVAERKREAREIERDCSEADAMKADLDARLERLEWLKEEVRAKDKLISQFPEIQIEYPEGAGPLQLRQEEPITVEIGS